MTETETIIEIEIDELHDSPTNPRRTYSEKGLDELAANIAAVGKVVQPLKVRPISVPLFTEADGKPMPDSLAGYEIVFGHRRRRGAKMAGLRTVPCMVCAMTDEQVRLEQLSENLQREDVHPIEEAEGFDALMREHQLSADDIKERTGKSRSYVYGRLKLLQACPRIRDACLAGKIGSEVALLVARLRTTKLQEKALAYIDKDYQANLEDGGSRSFRAVQALLRDKFTLELKEAIFDPEDATLLSTAGQCSSCPKRSGNAPEFADIAAGIKIHHWSGKDGGPNVCTDPDCSADKKKAHLDRAAAALRAKGQEVIAGNRAKTVVDAQGKLKPAYMPIKEVPAELKGMAAATLLGAPLMVFTIQDPRTGKTQQAVKVADVKAAGAKMSVHIADPAEKEAELRHRNDQEAARAKAKLERENGKRRALLDQVRAAVRARPRDAWDLRLVVRSLVGRIRDDDLLCELHGCKNEEELQSRIDSMSPDDLAALAIDCTIVQNVKVQYVFWLNQKPEDLHRVAQHYGVTAEGASTPSAAGASAKKGKAAAGKTKGKSNPGDDPAARGGDLVEAMAAETSEACGLQSSQTKPAVAGDDQSDKASSAGSVAWPFPRVKQAAEASA